MHNKLGSALGRKKAEIKTKEIHTFFMWNIWSARHLQVSGFLERNRQSLSFGLMIKWFLIGWGLGPWGVEPVLYISFAQYCHSSVFLLHHSWIFWGSFVGISRLNFEETGLETWGENVGFYFVGHRTQHVLLLWFTLKSAIYSALYM